MKAANNVKWKMYLTTRKEKKKSVVFPSKTFFLHIPHFCNIFLCNGCEHSFIFKVILVQVNPGEAFTIRREDGQFQCITGKMDNLFFLIFPDSEPG